MKSKFISLIVSVAVVLGLMLVPAVATPVVTASGVVGIEVVPSMSKVGYNQAFDVNISITDTVAQDMAAWTVYMTFNNTLMNVTGISPCVTLPTGKTADDVPGFPTWDNATGVIQHQSGTKFGDPYVNTSFVVMTVHCLSNAAVAGTGSLNFESISPTKRTWVEDGSAVPVLDWNQVFNGTVKVGKATLIVTVGQDLSYNVTYPGPVPAPGVPGVTNGTQYRMIVGAVPPNALVRADFCPMLDRMSSLGIPIKLQSADMVVDIATGDVVQQTVNLLAYLSPPSVPYAGYWPTTIVRNYVYTGAHGKPYSLGKSWSYNVSMYLPDLGMWSNATLYANVTSVDMVSFTVKCGEPKTLPAWHIVVTTLPDGGGTITDENWYCDYIGTGAFVKMVDYVTYAFPETTILSDTTGPYGDVKIEGVIPASYPNVTQWAWDTVVNLTALDTVSGWTFCHWNGDLVCSNTNPTTITMSEDKTVVAMFCELPPELSVAPVSFTGANKFSSRKGMENPADQTLDIWNSGGGTLVWSLSDDATWLNENLTGGSLDTGEHDSVLVSVNSLSPEKDVGTYWANITISGSPDVVVPVELEVKEATTINVVRDLPGDNLDPDQTYPGDQFTVYVNFTSPTDDFNAISLVDQAPAGWTVDTNKTWCTPEADEAVNRDTNVVEIAWHGVYAKGTNFSAVYMVTVPNTAAPGINLFPLDNGILAWAGYHFGAEPPMGQYSSNITGDYKMMITVPGKVWGETRDVNAHLLDTVLVTLSEEPLQGGDEPEDTCSSARPNAVYSNDVDDTGNYWQRAQKWCYNTLDMDTMPDGSPGSRNPYYPILMNLTTPELLAAGFNIDFEGDYGLVPRACNVTYAMESINKCNFVPKDISSVSHPEWRLTSWKAMESVDAWTNPKNCV